MEEHQLPRFSYEEDDVNNISKDDSEDFAVAEDTAFFRSTSISDSLLSPVASPTPFGTAHVWSAHSLYGEALLHSTRQLSASNNTNSTNAEDEDQDKMILGPQQPFIPEEDNDLHTYEDLLVSPTSPVSETPTTPPSVARKPALSPPPLILPDLQEHLETQEQQAPQPPPTAPPPTATAAAAMTAVQNLMAPAESMSYSSRTPLRPPRVPGNHHQGRTANNTNNTNNSTNNSPHKRQHHRNGSDSSFMSALTDVSFNSVQTAPPPPRSLPLPLLSSDSSWTRYTSGVVSNHLPVLDNHVSGMNISVPASLQQPLLGEDTPEGQTSTIINNQTSNNNSSTSPIHRHSTPPRHRPPKNYHNSQKQQKGARPKASVSLRQQSTPVPQKLPKTGLSSTLAASSQALARQKLQNRAGSISPAHGSNSSFVPIPRRTRSNSTDSSQDSPKIVKARSYSSSDVLPHPLTRESATTPHAETQSLPGISLKTLASPWEPAFLIGTENDNEDDNYDTRGPIQLEEWLTQAFSRIKVSRSTATDLFGVALLTLEARKGTPSAPEDDPPLRKIASATSTVTEVSRLSNTTRQQEARTLEPRVPPSSKDAFDTSLSEWAVVGALVAVLAGQVFVQDSQGNMMRSLVFVTIEKPLLLWLATMLASLFPQSLDPSPKAWHAPLTNEACLAFLLSLGWPRVVVIWAIMEWVIFMSLGKTAFLQTSPFSVSLRLSLVAFVAGILETARRFLVGNFLHTLIYKRFGRKVQRTLQRIAAIRSIARFARIPIRDCIAMTDEQEHLSKRVPVEELVSFQKIYSALRSDRALSPELGAAGDEKELKASAGTLYDAMAVQGRVRLATLQEATMGNDVLTSLIPVMFPSPANGIVSHPDFVAAIETLHKCVNDLLNIIDYEVTLLRVVDVASVIALNVVLLSMGLGSILPVAISGLVALVFAVALSASFEGFTFALFARPYDHGDVIILNCADDTPIRHEFGWKVEQVSLWNTCVKREGDNTGVTVLSNASLARCRITTFDASLPTVVTVRLHVSLEVSRHQLQKLRKMVEDYVRDNSWEWIDLVSLHLAEIRQDSIEFELRARHRQPACKLRSIRQSRTNLVNFCRQAQTHLGIPVGSPPRLARDVDMEYNDDISADTIAETDNELYFLANPIE